VLDGGVGSELVGRGVRWRVNGLRTDATVVAAVHDAYLDAGADVLRTNTFQLNRRSYRNVFRDAAHMRHIGAPDLEQRIPELMPRAVALAQEARERSGRGEVAIAGVMSPLEHCFRPDLARGDDAARAEHAEIALLLARAGVDLLLLESMNTIAEARVAMDAARATGLPVWISFVIGADGNILSGESPGPAWCRRHPGELRTTRGYRSSPDRTVQAHAVRRLRPPGPFRPAELEVRVFSPVQRHRRVAARPLCRRRATLA
jgi:S-methylmethionine-dependent homocysteine/selenocysteine methylase